MAIPITPEQLQKEPSFLALSEKFQALVLEYLKARAAGSENPRVDALYAAGYHPSTPQSAKVMGCVYFSKPAIKEVLNLADGFTPRDAFLAEVGRAASNPKIKPAQVWALRMKAQLNGWLPAPSVPAVKKVSAAAKKSVEPSAAVSEFEHEVRQVRF